MSFNSVGVYNGSFIGNSSAKPICGQFLTDMFKLQIVEAKVDTATPLAPGCAVIVKNKPRGGAAGEDLNPNVLSIDGLASGDTLSGFLLESPTDILKEGATAAAPVQGQIVNVALLGSGIELYLPAAADVSNADVNAALYWDATANAVTLSSTGNIPLSGKLLSPVVEGIKYVANANGASFADTQCVKIRL